MLAHQNLYEQILAGVSEAASNMVALAEHDVLYPDRYHDALLTAAGSGLCYNTNVWRLNSSGYFRGGNCRLLSNCGGPRDRIVRQIGEKLAEIRRRGEVIWAEPDGDGEFAAPFPTVDIRHGWNFTGDREAADGNYLQTIAYWGWYGVYTPLFTSVSLTASTTRPHTPAASPLR